MASLITVILFILATSWHRVGMAVEFILIQLEYAQTKELRKAINKGE